MVLADTNFTINFGESTMNWVDNLFQNNRVNESNYRNSMMDFIHYVN